MMHTSADLKGLGTLKGLDALKDSLRLSYHLAPICLLDDLAKSLETSRPQGPAGDFIKEHYLNYNLGHPEDFHSILVISYPQPHANVTVAFGDSAYTATIPSGYYGHQRAAEIVATIQEALTGDGLRAKRAYLPLKLLGARTGLTQYGKNNISYVADHGSQHRLLAFYTDLRLDTTSNASPDPISNAAPDPSSHNMALCKDCGLCAAACPYQAIPQDDFLLNTNRCLSFYMDLIDPLPEWVAQAPVQSLLGCNHCQSNCPVNQEGESSEVVHLGHIDSSSTADILSCEDYQSLSPETLAQTQFLDFSDWYPLFRRNFTRFIEDQAQ